MLAYTDTALAVNDVDDGAGLDFTPQVPFRALSSGSYEIYGGTVAAPIAVNANTTYGIDTSVENNYGLGPGYQSTAVLAAQTAAQKQAPSWWWLLVFLAAAWWCSR